MPLWGVKQPSGIITERNQKQKHSNHATSDSCYITVLITLLSFTMVYHRSTPPPTSNLFKCKCNQYRHSVSPEKFTLRHDKSQRKIPSLSQQRRESLLDRSHKPQRTSRGRRSSLMHLLSRWKEAYVSSAHRLYAASGFIWIQRVTVVLIPIVNHRSNYP